jgi:hypothetical protein
VFAAEDKAGKTWAMLDLACSVAAGVPWLGHFPCPSSGPVLVFLGEGGERAMVRRLAAICTHKHLDLRVANRTTSPDGASTVVLAVEVIGGEVADLAFRVRRTVRAEDPTDLASPLHYAVEVLPEDTGEDGPAGDLKPSRRWVLQVLRAGGAMQTVAQLGDRTAADGHQLKARTIQEALNDLEAAGLAAGTDPGAGLARYWSPADSDSPPVDGAGGGDQ